MLLRPAVAGAQAPPPNQVRFSAYEQETVRMALAQVGGEAEPAPEGKEIESVEIVRFEVLESRDLARPSGFDFELSAAEHTAVHTHVSEKTLERGVEFTRRTANRLHVVSREMTIRREVLFKDGDVYTPQVVQETARNIRRLPQIAQVVFVPMRGSAPGKVRVLYAVKDLWSLRLSYDLKATGGGVESLLITPQETNLFGLHHSAQTRFQYLPESYSFGAGYSVPRFGYSRISAAASATVVLNRRSGSPEGSAASLSVGLPLFSTRPQWAWAASVGFSNAVARRYSNARLVRFDSTTTTERDGIPFEYRSKFYTASASATRSMGWTYKTDVSFGLSAAMRRIVLADLSAYDPRAARDFVSNVPVAEDRVAPYAQLRTYENRFLAVTDLNTFALQEEYRLGYDAYVNLYAVPKAIGSARDVLGAYLAAQYTLPISDGLVRGSVESTTEREINATGDRLSDASVSAALRIVTPKLGIGRLLLDASALNRYRNYLNGQSLLGGDDRLRGYLSNAYAGKDVLLYNVEFRSAPVRLLSLQLGGVVFYDAGDAMNGFDMLRAKQSAGFGARTLIPWLNRVVFRADIGFPLNRTQEACPLAGVPCRIDPYNFAVSFEQAFGMGSI
jgi:hypothetical protein